jgi:23S rRNA (cytosine1962-C5)-methyltransferase
MSASDVRMLVCDDWQDYQLIDSGAGRKLERFGKWIVDRPDAQALWTPQTPRERWKPDAVFASKEEEDERGAWNIVGRPPPESWQMMWEGIKLNARLAAFRHMGVFPEHSVHWRWAAERIGKSTKPVKALNVFGYTGMMSLACAAAGAEVVHCDASPKAIAYGKENQSLSALLDRPIRWICDDAISFMEREVRRGRKYEAIILDPPKYGRGPKNEIWKFEDDFPRLLSLTRQLLSDEALFVILTVYAVRLSFVSVAQGLQSALDGMGGSIEQGEMAIREGGRGYLLPTGLYARWAGA